MKFYFIRHGESEANLRNEINEEISKSVSLTERGKRQVERAGKKLKGKDIDVIYCSPFLRTRQTAEIINKILKKKIIVDDRLKEIKLGFEGKNIEEYRRARRESGEDYYLFKLKGCESFLDVEKRFRDFVKEARKEEKNVLVVTHEIGLMVAGRILGNETKEEVVESKFGNAEILEFEVD